jgi:hypothetical protein
VWTEETVDELSIEGAVRASRKGRSKNYDDRIEGLDIEGEFDDGLLEVTERSAAAFPSAR